MLQKMNFNDFFPLSNKSQTVYNGMRQSSLKQSNFNSKDKYAI